MQDLIDRQTAIDDLFELYEYQRDIDPTEAADLVRQGIYLVEKKIEQLPPAEPERPTGHWIVYPIYPDGGEDVKCSECGKRGCAPYWDYCPECGARMEGVETEGVE